MSHIKGMIIEVRDKALNRLGQIVANDLDLLLEDQFNNVGSWQLRLSSDHPMASALRTPGAGIIVTTQDGETLFSGPTVKPEVSATAAEPGGILLVDGVTDTVILADRIAYPDPSNVDPETQTLSHDVRTGPIETLMHGYVNANIGPGAPLARRDTRLMMGTDLGRGASVTKRARFNVLGNLCAELAITANLGFRVVQVDDHLEFQTYEVVDRSASVRLDIRNNMLAGHKVATAPPGVTRVVVAGQGELVDRKFIAMDTPESIAAEAEWGRRIEKFIDQRQTNEDDELNQAGQEALAENGFSQLSMQVVPMEDFSIEYGHDWNMGDEIAVVVEGVELVAVVTGFVLRNNKDGFRMGAILGDPALSGRQNAEQRLNKVEVRVSNLERNAEKGTPEIAEIPGLQAELDALADAIDDPIDIADVTGLQAALDARVPLAAYPVGSIYMSVNSTSPATLFGGSWSRIQDMFLMAAGSTYDPGETGGSATRTLTTGNMPSHTHGSGSLDVAGGGSHAHQLGANNMSTSGGAGGVDFALHSPGGEAGEAGFVTSFFAGDHDHSVSGSTGSAGSGSSFSILPPYLAVYVWQRTA